MSRRSSRRSTSGGGTNPPPPVHSRDTLFEVDADFQQARDTDESRVGRYGDTMEVAQPFGPSGDPQNLLAPQYDYSAYPSPHRNEHLYSTHAAAPAIGQDVTLAVGAPESRGHPINTVNGSTNQDELEEPPLKQAKREPAEPTEEEEVQQEEEEDEEEEEMGEEEAFLQAAAAALSSSELASPVPTGEDVPPVDLGAFSTEERKLECTKCSNEFIYNARYKKVRCPHCIEVVVVPSEEEIQSSQRIEQAYYDIVGEFLDHFEFPISALAWLSGAMPSRSLKLVLPKNARFPRSSAGRGGYAEAFKRLGLQLREADTRSGHWHYWYVTEDVRFKELQRALTRRWKECLDYEEQVKLLQRVAERATGGSGDGGDDDEPMAGNSGDGGGVAGLLPGGYEMPPSPYQMHGGMPTTNPHRRPTPPVSVATPSPQTGPQLQPPPQHPPAHQPRGVVPPPSRGDVMSGDRGQGYGPPPVTHRAGGYPRQAVSGPPPPPPERTPGGYYYGPPQSGTGRRAAYVAPPNGGRGGPSYYPQQTQRRYPVALPQQGPARYSSGPQQSPRDPYGNSAGHGQHPPPQVNGPGAYPQRYGAGPAAHAPRPEVHQPAAPTAAEADAAMLAAAMGVDADAELFMESYGMEVSGGADSTSVPQIHPDPGYNQAYVYKNRLKQLVARR